MKEITCLTGEGTGERDATGLLGLGFDEEHDGGGELVVSVLALVDHLDDVDGVPRSLHGLALLRLVLSCWWCLEGKNDRSTNPWQSRNTYSSL
jgi:hypothetical protein